MGNSCSSDTDVRIRELEARVAELEPFVQELDGEIEELVSNIANGNSNFIRAAVNKNQRVGDAGALRITAALASNTFITTLDLSECWIGDEGAQAVASLLTVKNNCIAFLRLTANRIQEEGGIALANALKENTCSVTELYIGSTSPRHRNNMGPRAAIAFAEALKDNTTLKLFGFGYNNIQDEGAIALAEALTYNTTLNFLRLAENDIGNSGAMELARALKARISTIKTLGLFHNNIENKGIQALAEAMKQNDSLETLGIGKNPFGQEGTTALLDALEYNDKITLIDAKTFNQNAITEEQKASFKAIFSANSKGTRRRKIFDVEPSPATMSGRDWKQWILKVRHDRPPADLLEDLEPFDSRRPYDVFLANTGAQKESFLKPMRMHLQENCFRTFLDGDMRDMDGEPPDQMRFAIETCRYMVCVVSKEFLTRKAPCEELEYAFERMKWIEEQFKWRSFKVIFFNMPVKYYDDFRSMKRQTLPDLSGKGVIFEYYTEDYLLENSKTQRLFDSEKHLWDEVKTEMFRSDKNKDAVKKWEKYLSEWHEPLVSRGFRRASHLYPQTELLSS